MKWIATLLSVAVFAVVGCSSHEIPTTEKMLSIEPQPIQFKPPAPELFTLSNGIRVIFVEDDELPTFTGTLYVKGGAFWEAPAQLAAMNAFGKLMRSGGAASLAPEELDQALEQISASISTTMGLEYGSAAFSGLSSDLEKVLGLLSDVILRPRFDEERLSLYKSQLIEAIRRRKDSADTVADISFTKLLFGDSHLGQVVTSDDAKKISRDSLIALHKKYIRPDGALIAVSGAISKERLRDALETAFSDWKPFGEELVTPQVTVPKPQTGIYLIKLPFTQASVTIGQHGPQRLSPDYSEIEGLNAVLGASGDLSSLLAKEVRSDRGLAYSIAGGSLAGYPVGKNIISFETRSATTSQAIEAALNVINRVRNGDISAEELENAKRSLVNSFVFKFDTTSGIAQRRAVLTLLGYPEKYDDTYIDRITRLTVDDIKSTAMRRWDPSELVVIVVGDDTAIESFKKNKPALLKDLPVREMQFEETLVR